MYEEGNTYPADSTDLMLQSALVGGGILGGAGAADITRRRFNNRENAPTTWTQAGGEAMRDLQGALRTLTGRTPHDKQIENALDDEELKSKRSIRQWASGVNPAGSNSNYYTGYSPGIYQSNPITQAAIAARDAFNPSGEDFLSLNRVFRQEQGFSAEGPRSDTIVNRIPLVDGIRDALGSNRGGFSPEEREFRDRNNLSIMGAEEFSWESDGTKKITKARNVPQKIGGVLGRGAGDFVNNGVRSLWWLLNAPQAVVDIGSEWSTGKANRQGLYGQDLKGYREAVADGWIDPADGTPLNNSINRIAGEGSDPFFRSEVAKRRRSNTLDPKDPSYALHNTVYSRRRMGNNLSTLMALPAAIAINEGIGLVSPFGGTDGRKAIFPTDEDPTKTSNVIAEVASKYILGRQGDLLPWNEFKQVRPDVSKDEYMRYKAHRWDKKTDLNPFDDGDVVAPLGLAKFTDDGINGMELQFLGKDMPISTAIMPTLAALGGTMAGAAVGNYGSLNERGINEALARREAQKGEIVQKDTDRFDDNKWSPTPQNKARVDELENEMTKLRKRKDFVQKVPGLGRIKNRNAALTGLVAGTTAMLGTRLIGGEMERRRREENQQQNQLEGNWE